MGKKDFYTNAHLFVAAIRVLQHQTGAPPTVAEVCRFLGYSQEMGGYIRRRLTESDVIDTVKRSYEDRLFVSNHLNLEPFRDQPEEDQMDQALAKFQQEREHLNRKVESIKAAQAKKQKNLFEELESRLKQDLRDRLDE